MSRRGKIDGIYRIVMDCSLSAVPILVSEEYYLVIK